MKIFLMILMAIKVNADITKLTKEYVLGATEVKNTKFLYDNQKLLTALEKNKRAWNLSLTGEAEDSNLETNALTSLTSGSSTTNTQTLALTKDTIWGGALLYREQDTTIRIQQTLTVLRRL